MKKIVIIILLIIGFIGCGSNSTEESSQVVKNLLTIEANCLFNEKKLYLHAKYFEKIENQEVLDIFISDLNYRRNDTNISRIEVDFAKYNVLIYYTKYNAQNQIDEYREEITIESNNSVKIKQIFTGHTKEENKYFGEALQLRLYHIDKTIKYVEMVHEDEISQISMDNPSKPTQDRVVSFFVHTQGYGEEMIEVFDDNDSYQIFLNEQNIREKPTKDIDFKRYRVLYRVVMSGYGAISRVEETIRFPKSIVAEIVNKNIRPKDMYGSATGAALAYDFLIYLVDRDIESVEIVHQNRDNTEIDMRN